MERCTTIHHRLELALRLLDTTSGHNISGRAVEISSEKKRLHYAEKPGGILIFQDLPSSQFWIEIRSRDYEPLKLWIDLSTLEAAMPLLEFQMIPGPHYRSGNPILTLEGTLPGISDLMAVRAGESPCLIREVDPRKKLVKIFNPHHLTLERSHYALVNPDQGQFEPLHVLQLKDQQTLQVKQAPQMEFKNYFPICPIVFGLIGPSGRYCLRVQDDAQNARWLLRYTVDGEVRFFTVDFHQEGQVVLP